LRSTREAFIPVGDAMISITTSNVTAPRRDVDSADVLGWGARRPMRPDVLRE
jgi:hypothetical protein